MVIDLADLLPPLFYTAMVLAALATAAMASSACDCATLARGGPDEPADPSQAEPATSPLPGKPERRAACRCRFDQPEVWRADHAR